MGQLLKLSLLENSRSFLSEALAKVILAENDAHQWKFAIFNMCQAIEISLKERLQREHPALMLENIDKGDRTVSPLVAISRLRKFCNIKVSKSDLAAVECATRWRNEIVHSDFSLKVPELKSAFAVLLGFLRSFHEVDLKEPLSEHVQKELWAEALAIQDYGEELFKRAFRQIEEEGIEADHIIYCPRCGRLSCVLREDTSRCYVCGATEDLIECESCCRLVPVSLTTAYWAGIPEDDMWEERVCRDCIDSAEGRQIQYLIDLERGK